MCGATFSVFEPSRPLDEAASRSRERPSYKGRLARLLFLLLTIVVIIINLAVFEA